MLCKLHFSIFWLFIGFYKIILTVFAVAINGLDLLGAVSSIGNIRNISTKNGKQMQVREVVIFDHTNSGLRFSIWESDLITRFFFFEILSTLCLFFGISGRKFGSPDKRFCFWQTWRRNGQVFIDAQLFVWPVAP